MTREETEAYFRGIEETLNFFRTLSCFNDEDIDDANCFTILQFEEDKLEKIIRNIYDEDCYPKSIKTPTEMFLVLRDDIRIYIATRKHGAFDVGDEVKEVNTGNRAFIIYVDTDDFWHVCDSCGVHCIKPSEQIKYKKTGRKIHEIIQIMQDLNREGSEPFGSINDRDNDYFWESEATPKILM